MRARVADPDELSLIQRCADGEDAAWSELLRRYGAFLEFIVRRALAQGGRLPAPDRVLEVKDEVLAWLIEDEGRVLRTYRGESRITSWLGVVVGRRARRIARRGSGLESRTVSLDALTAEATSHLARDDGADEGSERQVALAKLGDALEQLPERDRALLRGAFYDKRSYEEMAEELGVRPDSIGQLLFRAKQKLKKALGDTKFLATLSVLATAVLSCWWRAR